MFRSRFWMLVAALGLTLGPLLGTAGYGLYLRSGFHADRVAQRVAGFLGAPVQIGSIVPLDPASQDFRDVVVWLPGEFLPIFYCQQVIVHVDDNRAIELELHDGQIRADTDAWNQATLVKLLRTAFGHNFHQARVASVRLINMDIAWRRGKAMLQARGANGRIDLSGQAGRIDILCDSLNDQRPAEPLAISCRFQSGNPPLIDQLSLSVKQLPIAALARPAADAEDWEASNDNPGQQETAGQPEATTRPTASATQPSNNWLTGTIVYRQKTRGSPAGQIEFSGELSQVDLGLFASRLCKQNLAGILSGTVDKGFLENGQLQNLEGRLHVDDLRLAPLLALAGCPQANGSATLDMHHVRYEDGQIKALLAAGQVHDLDLDPILRKYYGGTISGRLNAQLQKLKIIDGRLDEIAAEIRMAPPPEGGMIDQAVLTAAAQQLLGIEIPPVLSDRIGYTDLGARLHGADSELYLEGIAGPEDKYLLVIDVSPTPIPLIAQPTSPLPLESLQAMITTRLKSLQTSLSSWPKVVAVSNE